MRAYLLAGAVAFAAMAGATGASAQAIIDQGTIQLGVDRLAQLNTGPGYPSATGTSTVGLRDLRTGYESTSPGCLCEGWGIADITNNYSGYANNALGSNGLTFVSFAASGAGQVNANSVGSKVVAKSSVGNLLITHSFEASASSDLYRALVTVTNTGATATGNLVYRRTMDWDIEPTPFNEYSTIQGVSGNVTANNNGFCNSNPLASCGSLGASGNFIDYGPSDQGANFDIGFAPLAAGASQRFAIFYGASLSESLAQTALTAVGANVYSFGQSSNDRTGGNGSTFIFAFRGLAGTGVPEPASWAMMIAGFGLVGGMMRRKALMQA